MWKVLSQSRMQEELEAAAPVSNKGDYFYFYPSTYGTQEA